MSVWLERLADVCQVYLCIGVLIWCGMAFRRVYMWLKYRGPIPGFGIWVQRFFAYMFAWPFGIWFALKRD